MSHKLKSAPFAGKKLDFIDVYVERIKSLYFLENYVAVTIQ